MHVEKVCARSCWVPGALPRFMVQGSRASGACLQPQLPLPASLGVKTMPPSSLGLENGEVFFGHLWVQFFRVCYRYSPVKSQLNMEMVYHEISHFGQALGLDFGYPPRVGHMHLKKMWLYCPGILLIFLSSRISLECLESVLFCPILSRCYFLYLSQHFQLFAAEGNCDNLPSITERGSH